MTLLDKAEAWLARKGKVAAGVAVTYGRAPKAAPLTAVPGDQQAQAARLNQLPQAVSTAMTRDYFVVAADLAAAGFEGPPQRGDTITETLAGEAVTFEVVNPNKDTPCWSWSGAGRLVYRVHARRVP